MKEFGIKLDFLIIEKLDNALNKRNYKAVIIDPHESFSLLPHEIKTFKDYLLNGGSYLLLLGLESKDLFNDSMKLLLDVFRVFPRYIKLDSEESIRIDNLVKHQITEWLSTLDLVNGISFISSPENVILARTGKDCVVSNVPVLLAGQRGSGKYVVYGSQRSFDEINVEDEKNLQLLLNIICWLLDFDKCHRVIETPQEKEEKEEEIEIKTIEVSEEIAEEEVERKEEEEAKETHIEEEINKTSYQIEQIPHNEKNNTITNLIKKYDSLKGEIEDIKKKISTYEISEIADKIDQLTTNFERYVNVQSMIIDYLKAIREEISNLEIDLLEAVRDDINAITQLLERVDKMEKNIEKKFKELSKNLRKK